MSVFNLKTAYQPAGDQPKAIKELTDGFRKGLRYQTLFGVTGSGKTFTAANIIANLDKPTLVIAHNKTLAAQLAQEYRDFFPTHAVHYFVSYYDYYQPEAYMPVTDTYIEKEAMINEEIDRLRHASTQALLTRKDVIIVASVSCIYGLGSPEEYEKVNVKTAVGDRISRSDLIRKLIAIYFERTNADLKPGQFRAVGNTVEIMPVNEKIVYRVVLTEDSVSLIEKIDGVSRVILETIPAFFLFPTKHFVTPEDERLRAIEDIKVELEQQLSTLKKAGKNLEAERLKRRTNYDLALIREVGYCNGIENYSRHFSGKKAGDAPDTLLSYFPHKKDGTPDFLTIIDESHVTVPQLGAMYAGDQSRKASLVDFGFRLPSAKDNRPLQFHEFEQRVGQVLFTSATPGPFEKKESEQIVEQVIRPTGLIDPEVSIRKVSADSYTSAKSPRPEPLEGRGDRPTHPSTKKGGYRGQIKDFIEQTILVVKGGGRVIATTLTKKMAEDLSEYLREQGIKAEYLHSDIKTIDRIDILTNFRRGKFDCLVGVNLLREGLDLPEVELIGILDADKEGFLRSETSLIQIIGRAARNVKGRVFLYADSVTGSIERAMRETNRRRGIQVAYNTKHGITPQTIIKKITDITSELRSEHDKAVDTLVVVDASEIAKDPKRRRKIIAEKEKQMKEAVQTLDFETAALLRDEIQAIKELVVKTPKKKTK